MTGNRTPMTGNRTPIRLALFMAVALLIAAAGTGPSAARPLTAGVAARTSGPPIPPVNQLPPGAKRRVFTIFAKGEQTVEWNLTQALPVGGQHGPITITSNADFTGAGSSTGCACVTAGSGTAADPFVIGPWAIGAPSSGTHGWGIKVDNSAGGVTDSFVISGISIGYTGVPFTDAAIQLVGVRNPSGTRISNVSANEDGRGVELDGSSYVTLDQLSLNKMTGNALFINGSSYIVLSNSKLKATADGQVPHNADGFYAFNSDHLAIGGVPACPMSQICNTFDYNTGWGASPQRATASLCKVIRPASRAALIIIKMTPASC